MAVLLSLTPGPGMALVVRNAAVRGTGAAARTTVGSSIGVGVWAVLSALGVSALIAASEMAFVGLKVAGVAVLVWFGVQALRGSGEAPPRADPARRDFASGLLTALANPKLAVFFLALFPQFIPDSARPCFRTRSPWPRSSSSPISSATSRSAPPWPGPRARSRAAGSPGGIEQLTGAVLLALAGRLAYETR